MGSLLGAKTIARFWNYHFHLLHQWVVACRDFQMAKTFRACISTICRSGQNLRFTKIIWFKFNFQTTYQGLEVEGPLGCHDDIASSAMGSLLWLRVQQSCRENIAKLRHGITAVIRFWHVASLKCSNVNTKTAKAE